MTEPAPPNEPGASPASPASPVEPRLPPDPAAYDHPRAAHARARGLSAPYIPGGNDPNPERARAEERRYLRLLIAMVVIVVLSGFVLGIVQNLLGPR